MYLFISDFTKEDFDEYFESIHVATIWIAVLSFTWEAVVAMLQ